MNRNSGFLQVNLGYGWIDLPTPDSDNYKPTYTHEEKSYRDARRILHRDIIRRNEAKIFCGWKSLSGEQSAFLQNLYDYDDFMMRFTDSKNRRVERKMYAGPLDGKVKYADKETYLITKRTDVQMNFMEV
ncbi:MAG: hypothetical protein IJ568_05665 [Bacilli bacterium]|nr:hypothetical protein [Bacilli bacterium]